MLRLHRQYTQYTIYICIRVSGGQMILVAWGGGMADT